MQQLKNNPFMKDGKTPRCQESSVPDRGTNWPSFHQCMRAANAKSPGWCKQHSPEEVARLAKMQDDKYNADWKRRRIELYGSHFLQVLQRIAEGHNDPRRLAREALDEFNQ